MRKVLFRGKRKDNGEWIYGFFYLGDEIVEGNATYIAEFDGKNNIDEHEVDPETVGQFTGLHDKNGKEIYEGDKVEYDYFYNEFEMPDGTGYWEWQRTWDVVVWDTDMFSVDGIPLSCIQDANGWQESDKYPFPDGHESGLIVIGSIHDNPELLEAE